MPQFRSTTIIIVRKNDKVAIAGDGQVTLGQTVVKGKAKKIRKIYDGKILTGFAGSSADAFTLFEKFETKINEYNGDITRASVELAKDWRLDRALRRLEALLVVADKKHSFLISGTGDVIEPDEGVIAIGSGGNYALAAAKAFMADNILNAVEIAEKSLKIASEICVYTNSNISVEEITA